MTALRKNKLKAGPLLVATAMLLVASSSLGLIGRANAAQFQQAYLRLDTLTAGTATGGRICVKPASVAVEDSIKVMFPTTAGTDYVVNGTASNWTTNTNDLDPGQTALPITGNVANNVNGKTVTFPVASDLSVGTLYCFNFSATSTLTTSSASAAETTQGTITSYTSAPAVIDQTTYAQSIITNDKIVLSAVVPPSFSFVLSGNTDSFATNLSTGSVVSTGGRTVTLTTNAASGWVVWVKGLNDSSSKGALQSVAASNYKIAGSAAVGTASRTLSPGSEDYGLGATVSTDAANGGAVSLDAAYDGTSTKAGTIDPTAFRPIASSNGTANGDIITLTERATIAGQTPAASDYTDTLTVIGAGVF